MTISTNRITSAGVVALALCTASVHGALPRADAQAPQAGKRATSFTDLDWSTSAAAVAPAAAVTQLTHSLPFKKAAPSKPVVTSIVTSPSAVPLTRYMHGCDSSRWETDPACACSASARCTDMFGGDSITIEAGVTLLLRLDAEAGQAEFATVSILDGDVDVADGIPVDDKAEAFRVPLGATASTVASITSLHNAPATVSITFPTPAARFLQATITPLVQGVPVTGTVAFGSYTYFSFALPAPPMNTTITVTPTSGDPDLYVSLTPLLPNTTYYNYYSNSITGDDIVTITSNDAAYQQLCPAGCIASISVYGWRSSGFSIVALASTGTPAGTALTPGLPQLIRTPAASLAYFTFTPTDYTSIVTLAVTPFSGDPDIFVSVAAPFPSPGVTSSYCAYSMTTSRDVVELMPGSPCFCTATPCQYFITIMPYGSVNAVYSIVGSTRTSVPTTLVDGRSQVGFVAQGESSQYVFTTAPMVGVRRRAVEFSLSPTLGDPDIYINLGASAPSPTPGSYDYYAAGSSGPDYVSILSSDPTYLTKCGGPSVACVFKITVFAYTTCIYSVVATSSGFLTLRDGTTVVDSGPGATFNFYRFIASSSLNNIYITVTPLTGNPNLFVTTAVNASTRPGPYNYMWRSVGFGVKAITIRPTDPNACAPPCTYYISVLAVVRNATYSIMARTGSAAPALLTLNVPVTDRVTTGLYNNYIIGFNPALSSMAVTVLPTNGDPDLYVRLDNQTVTTSNYQYASRSANGPDIVTIRTTDSAYLNCSAGGATCYVSIAVYGFSTSQYSIIAAEGITMLPDSVSVPGSVAASRWNYYVYEMDTTVPVTISVTALSGDPDMYVSVTSTRPNATNSQWISNGLGPEVVYITTNDAKLALCISNPCRLYIGLFAWGSMSAVYTITAAASNMTTLPDTLPVTAYGLGWSMTYFVYTYPDTTGVPNPAGLEFIATPFAGSDVSLYISNRLDSNGNPLLPVFTTHPSSGGNWGVTNYQWSSFGSFSRERVTIANTDSNFNASGQYFVAVLVLNNEPAQFGVVGAVLGSSVTLENGVPMQDAAAIRTYNYYRLINDIYNSDVRVTVTPLQGDPDLYVSVHSAVRYPNRTANDKRSTAGGTAVDSVLFQWSELPECQAGIDPVNGGECDIWISVFGFTNTSYTITATASNGTEISMLLDGVPQTATVARFSYTYFYANVLVPAGQTYSVYVRPLSGDPDLYIRTDNTLPTISNYQYSSTHFSGDDYVNIAPGSAGYITSGRVSIGVYGFQNSSFQITFSTTAAVVQLADGVSQSGAVPSGGSTDIYVYYSFALAQPNVTVTIALTAVTGDPDVFVGVWNTPGYRPTRSPTSYTWAGTAYGSDVVAIAPLTPMPA